MYLIITTLFLFFAELLSVAKETHRATNKKKAVPEAINDCPGIVTCEAASVFRSYLEHANYCFSLL